MLQFNTVALIQFLIHLQVVFPYIKHKLDEKFEEIRHRANIGQMSQVCDITDIWITAWIVRSMCK